MIANALEYASQNNWQRRQAAYLEQVDALIENRPVTLDGGKPDVPAGNSKDDLMARRLTSQAKRSRWPFIKPWQPRTTIREANNTT